MQTPFFDFFRGQVKMEISMIRLLVLAVLSLMVTSVVGEGKGISVAYDGRSMIINGSREILFSGSIHYPRSPPEMWKDILKKAKDGGLDIISTYVFWNVHEPVQGQWNFEGNNDLVKFIRMIGELNMYVMLRVGPFIEAEWNFGGFPYWLREIPGITFRSDNEPFKYHMQKFVSKIIDLMKQEKLFAPQGGPIIMAQIENEYNNVQGVFKENGARYIQWAANMAVALQTGVPWVMCKQEDAPTAVINTCNGRQCGDTFTGPNGPNKPSLWTENWTAQYRVFGDAPSQRTAEDIAYSVARFFSKNGTHTNYYMYYGGTNYGRSGSSFVTTRYYDEAPIDEYGLLRGPKWGHLKDLHRALKLSKKPLLWGTPGVERQGDDLEIRTFEKPGEMCAAFLINNKTRDGATIKFRGQDIYLPAKSISILPDCKTVVYNTQTIVAQQSSRNFVPSTKACNLKWEMFRETILTTKDMSNKNKMPQELYGLTKDTSDYAWYSTSINSDGTKQGDLQVANLGHAMLAFVNGEYIGFEHGSDVDKSFSMKKPITLKPGQNHITLLGMTVGFPDSGAYMERKYAGVRAVTIVSGSQTRDITQNTWGHEVGVRGEKLQLYTEQGVGKVQWTPAAKGAGPPLTWYKTKFDAPEGDCPVALRMTSMAKGMVWVNGKSIGRYWTSYLTSLGQPSQSEYHIPRPFLKPANNLLVVFEETGGNPEGIEVLVINRDTICSFMPENAPADVDSWERNDNQLRTVVKELKSAANLTCPDDKLIKSVEFASFGDPTGQCGNYTMGKCNSPNIQKVVEQNCLGKKCCTIPLDRGILDDKSKDSCPDLKYKTLAVQLKCAS
ncbi:beta-galactosidase 13-like [Cornus florida]|uniref:beta-galactosidase 13-like n=1 Tax=Cornus florida TaxID=4283 RepID=UPI0028A27503|nr:beta-galactosidase 13-like [Cornus florida]